MAENTTGTSSSLLTVHNDQDVQAQGGGNFSILPENIEKVNVSATSLSKLIFQGSEIHSADTTLLELMDDMKDDEEVYTLTKKPFYFVRNGQTDWDVQRLIIGKQDPPLNLKGFQQAEKIGNILKDRNIKTICYSPLTRARQTAEVIADLIKAKLIEVDELREKNSGILEGQGYTQEAYDEWYKRFLPEGAESWENFNKRTEKAINKCLQQEGPVLVVGHGGTYSSISQILKNGVKDIQNCAPIIYRPPTTPNETWQEDWVD